MGWWIHRDSPLLVGKAQALFSRNFLIAKATLPRNSLSLADQDLLNILGSQTPWLIQPLPCHWHFHTWSCSTEIYESKYFNMSTAMSFPMQLLKQVHLSDETRSEPMSNSGKTRRLSVTWQLSGVHHGDMTNDTITFRCMISSWCQEMICIIQFSIRCKKNMKGYWLGAQQGREETVQPATAVSRWRCAESGLHILGGPGHTNNHDPLFWRTFAVLKQ